MPGTDTGYEMSDKMRAALEKIAAHDCDGDARGYNCRDCRTCIAVSALNELEAQAEQRGEVVAGHYVIRYNDDGEFGQKTGWLYRDGGDPCVVTGKPVYVWRPLRDLIGKQPAPFVPEGMVMVTAKPTEPELKAGMAREALAQPEQPIDMVLFCPKCGVQHIDGPEETMQRYHAADFGKPLVIWDNPPHRSHLCQGCGHIWRPADVATNGVLAIKTKGNADSPVVRAAPDDEWLKWASSAYQTLRRYNSSIPDEVLDRMRAILAASPPAPPLAAECSHLRDYRTTTGGGTYVDSCPDCGRNRVSGSPEPPR